MSAAENIDHVMDEIKKIVSEKNGMDKLFERLKEIDELVKRFRELEEDRLFYEMVNESLKDVWDNEKDDAYNDL